DGFPAWIEDATVGGVLRRTAAQHPTRDALVFPALHLRRTWAELDRQADALASALIARGVRPGEHGGIWSMDTPQWVRPPFAVARAGAVLVNINPAYRLHELESALAMADVATLIVGAPFKGSDFVAMIEALCPEVAAAGSPDWAAAKLPALRRLSAADER